MGDRAQIIIWRGGTDIHYLIVDIDSQKVRYMSKEWTFADFVKNDCKEWRDL
jgi:hypothetical protein